ncbi:MAG: uncharacterized protein H6Q00_3416 [Holophagaceae bacterium]|nr:uncharacterized protein [Holophagaceae bacterium]
MRVGIVGGVDRAESLYERVARKAGHEIEFHDGGTRGRGIHALEGLVDRCDLVIVITDVNSHGAVLMTRRLMRGAGRTPLLLRHFGVSRLAKVMAEFGPTSH